VSDLTFRVYIGEMADLATDYFTKNIDRTWRLFENLEAGMIGMNTGNSSAAETPFGGIKESGYGKESGKDVAIAEYMVSPSFVLWLSTSIPY
jgi:succinate-semialdehyde dehydrogenase/glutarate-semialdehyde dehydrogenase